MSSDLIQTGNQLVAHTPDGFAKAIRSVADVRVHEVLGRHFSAELQLFKLPRTAFFRLKLPSTRAVIPEASGFVAVNMITNGQLRTAGTGRRCQWDAGTAHVVNHDNCRYDFTSDADLDAMALCFQKPLLQEYERKFHGRDDLRWEQFTSESLHQSGAGACFMRYATFVWEELNRGGVFLQSPRATEEIEDSLWALLLSAVQGEGNETCQPGGGGYVTYVKSAEEFIVGNLNESLRVVDIAAAVGVSVPTLNRAFRKCHGIGPRAFVKSRRLERVRSELLSADPRATSVTAVATKHAFWHLSQFAADYKRVYHEAPSTTLRRGHS